MNYKEIIVTLISVTAVANASYITINDPGNDADTRQSADSKHYGAVAYTYKIGTHEVTIAEFQAAYTADNRISSNRNENWWNDGGQGRTVGTSAPAAQVNWYEAAKYCNWLTTGNAYNGAYQFDGSGTLTGIMTRSQILEDGGLFYLLPTEDEWYKAAYYNLETGSYYEYANGMNTPPLEGDEGANYADYTTVWTVGSGLVEQNGTYDMMGNVYEWTESSPDGSHDIDPLQRIKRGGSYAHNQTYLVQSLRYAQDPNYEYSYDGFRVAVVPEPATAISLFLGGLVVTGYRRTRKAYGL